MQHVRPMATKNRRGSARVGCIVDATVISQLFRSPEVEFVSLPVVPGPSRLNY